ncbi:hypothetical protein [Actinomadura citrea]|uniref:Uncharacterized protein n=1 Tax=Actinomadura citrea TaxID=46158 RepID=A0A7Y9G6M3_9ACTN|nr:hypothetical protein [Actinomadura citrea]NYE10950.1 hypothetical protein [Actinomadura citrea]GGU07455.1 hypothetical protein GCM10010177_78370 [Actinomadura citrea]
MTSSTELTGQTSLLVPGDLFARHQTITGLRALADFLEANPAVPVNEYGREYNVYTRSKDEAAAVAMVDQVAALLSAEVTDNRSEGGHYSAERTFGRITYGIVHVPQRRHDEYDAYTSYRHNIRLDPEQDGDEGRAA